MTSDSTHDEADYSSPIKLQWCWQRRGLALDQCKLVAWECDERWVRLLLQSMTRECPADYSRPIISQIVQADREAFLIMAADIKDLRPAADGVFPMSAALDALRTDPRITMFLMPMPVKRPAAISDHPADVPVPPPGPAAKTRAAKRREREKRRRETLAAAKATAEKPGKVLRATPPPVLAALISSHLPERFSVQSRCLGTSLRLCTTIPTMSLAAKAFYCPAPSSRAASFGSRVGATFIARGAVVFLGASFPWHLHLPVSMHNSSAAPANGAAFALCWSAIRCDASTPFRFPIKLRCGELASAEHALSFRAAIIPRHRWRPLSPTV